MKYILLGLTLVTCTVLAMTSDADEQVKERSLYCERVQMWIDSAHENGHPNFRNVECE